MKVNVNESKCKFNYTKTEKNELYDYFFFDPEKYLRPDNKKTIEVLHTSSENNIPNCCTAR